MSDDRAEGRRPDDHEERIRERMRILGIDRMEAEFIDAIESGEIEGDCIMLDGPAPDPAEAAGPEARPAREYDMTDLWAEDYADLLGLAERIARAVATDFDIDESKQPSELLEIDPLCFSCRHLRAGTLACNAFPDGIPDAILLDHHDHHEPYPGDRGVRFEPADPAEPRPAK